MTPSLYKWLQEKAPDMNDAELAKFITWKGQQEKEKQES